MIDNCITFRWSVLRAADKISDLQQISQEFTQVAICVRAAMGSLASDKAELLHRHTEDVISSFVTALEVSGSVAMVVVMVVVMVTTV